MKSEPKAILSRGQVLLAAKDAGDDSGMKSNRTKDAEALGARIGAALAACGDKEAQIRREICEELGITNQAISGWVKTGRISKQALPVVVKRTGQSLDYFLGTADMTAQEQDEVELVLASRQLPETLKAALLEHARTLLKLSEQAKPQKPKRSSIA